MPRRPESFNEVADLYDRARPLYPQELIDDLFILTGIRSGDRILEIGSGTGQITVPLAERGLHVIALEPGSELAKIVRTKVTARADIEVIEQKFEDYELPPQPFDMVVSATAFHWVEPAVRTTKAGAALRPGGYLAIIDTHWGVSKHRDAFSTRSQACYQHWDPEAQPGFVPPIISELPTTLPELEESLAFTSMQHRFYKQINRYTTGKYLDLLRTFSNVQGLDSAKRVGLLACLERLIDNEFGGRLSRSDLRELWLAEATGAAA